MGLAEVNLLLDSTNATRRSRYNEINKTWLSQQLFETSCIVLGIVTDLRYNSYHDSEPPIQQLNDTLYISQDENAISHGGKFEVRCISHTDYG